MNNRIKLCSFDITNTLLKFRISVGEQYARVGRMYGVERHPDFLSKAFQQQWKIMNSTHPNYGCNTGLSSKDWWITLAKNVFQHNSSELTEHQMDSVALHLYDLYKGNSCWGVAPGATSLLKLLRQKGVKVGVISNFDERLDSVLDSTGLKSYFNFILASSVVKVAKPDKKIFDIALSKCNGIPSIEALHVGDDVELDYEAAKMAGWNALLLANEAKILEAYPHFNPNDVIQDFEQIEKYVLFS